MKPLPLWAACLAAASLPCLGQAIDGVHPVPMPPGITVPRDVAYPGTIRLRVDATDIDRRIFRAEEEIPVSAPGSLTLLFARWLPGYHGPVGPVDQLAGLVITAGGKPVEWTRDLVDMGAFHLEVPSGASTLELSFQFVSPVDPKVGRVIVTEQMLNLEWNLVVLYPAGHYARRIQVEPSLRLPSGWGFGTALETAGQDGDFVRFKPVSLETLVDSPLLAGRYFKRLDLDPGAAVPVRLDIVADEPGMLEVSPAQLAAHRALVQQAYRLFGARHYDHYDFLLAASDELGGTGIEHHRSSEDATVSGYFSDWDHTFAGRDLLAHEYTHSWNGKFRRPADLWTPDFDVPMRDSLLWVYEGQTQYWGYVLAARSGLLTPQQVLDALALVAANYDRRAGRTWRALQDTTNDPILAMRRPQSWTSWQRSEDYYSEGQLIWLDADTWIREQTGGRRSLDDFARAFFGMEEGSYAPLTYGFDDVVQALDQVCPNDWAGFLRTRLDGHAATAPLDGLRRGGYRLVFGPTPSDYFKGNETRRKITDLGFSLGLAAAPDGTLASVAWESPAFKAGLTADSQIVAVNGFAYSDERLKAAVAEAARPGSGPIVFIVKAGDQFRTVAVDYHGGPRYPRLERMAGTPGRLDDILKPL